MSTNATHVNEPFHSLFVNHAGGHRHAVDFWIEITAILAVSAVVFGITWIETHKK